MRNVILSIKLQNNYPNQSLKMCLGFTLSLDVTHVPLSRALVKKQHGKYTLSIHICLKDLDEIGDLNRSRSLFAACTTWQTLLGVLTKGGMIYLSKVKNLLKCYLQQKIRFNYIGSNPTTRLKFGCRQTCQLQHWATHQDVEGGQQMQTGWSSCGHDFLQYL